MIKHVIKYHLRTCKCFHKGCVWYMRPTTQIYQRATSVNSYCFVRGQIIDDFNLVITEFKKKMIKVV